MQMEMSAFSCNLYEDSSTSLRKSLDQRQRLAAAVPALATFVAEGFLQRQARDYMTAVAASSSSTQPAPDTLDTTLLLNTLMALKRGDFSVRLPATWTGVSGKIADTLNEVI